MFFKRKFQYMVEKTMIAYKIPADSFLPESNSGNGRNTEFGNLIPPFYCIFALWGLLFGNSYPV